MNYLSYRDEGLPRNDEGQEQIDAKIKTGLEEVKAMALKENPEETEATAEHQEVSNKEAAVETMRAPEDQSGDWHLAVRHHGWLKKWTQGDSCSSSSWPPPMDS
jgi:hypothetical protein